MLPVEKTSTEIMKPNVSAIKVMKGTLSGAEGKLTTVELKRGPGEVIVSVDVGAWFRAVQGRRASEHRMPRVLRGHPLTLGSTPNTTQAEPTATNTAVAKNSARTACGRKQRGCVNARWRVGSGAVSMLKLSGANLAKFAGRQLALPSGFDARLECCEARVDND